ncbi:ATP-citrate synthase [Auxenochlorella protothecoides]|uniref:ATP citrate synthase n=2 Tax=Auxenochlorella protothecoides TaxID=3075 RepID=A0A087SKX3_AUXPR|nr:ATP-citrate synthase [Auxenochlorella protothecoides]KFM26377.1 ATP-citrate synthase [Auxenochlorella protothecoides]
MARKKIREYNSKTLLKVHAARLGGLDLPIRVAQVKADTDFGALVTAHPWLSTTPLVVKPDCLFGKRGKHDLVGLKLDLAGAEDFIAQRMGKYYLCIQSTRAGTDLSFSEAGGVEIEEHWDQVRSVSLAVGEAVTGEALAPLLATLPLELRPGMEAFLATAHAVFTDLDFTLMEMNPFTLGPDGAPFPLDMRGELDDTAAFRSAKKWGDLEFPLPFGRRLGPAEAAVARMDEGTGASLKLSVLNPRGRVWTMVAGGGASVIYADTVGDLGAADELGNYAEYSGGPNAAETHAYALRLLDCTTAGPDGRARALIVGGGIANFTDVAATFKGIIQAIRERADAVKAARLKLFVRRGGPNYRAGLDAMRALGSEIGIDIEVYGPEASMTGICKLAIDHLKDSDARDAKAAQ